MQTQNIPVAQSAVQRLLGQASFQKLQTSTVMIVGVGGVGSWCAEALGRSGVGHLILVDADEVCESNINRQILATYKTVGKQKVEVLKERLLEINPNIIIDVYSEFCTENNVEKFVGLRPDLIIDAIDGVSNKCLLLATAKANNVPIVCTGGGAGKWDVTQLKVSDLALTVHDPLLYWVRKKLRDKFNFTRKKRAEFGIPTIYSMELPTQTESEQTCSTLEGQACEQKMGSLVTITSTIGMFAANESIKMLVQR
jgi:tRNA A37 threonylcarbamoyladenosine dehydratase